VERGSHAIKVSETTEQTSLEYPHDLQCSILGSVRRILLKYLLYVLWLVCLRVATLQIFLVTNLSLYDLICGLADAQV
jgi:hypothetical protein